MKIKEVMAGIHRRTFSEKNSQFIAWLHTGCAQIKERELK